MASLTLPQWDVALRLARASNLLGRLACEAESLMLTEMLPPQVQPHFVAARRLVAHQQQSMVRECRMLQQALADLCAPIVLLKGAAYAQRDLAAARGRLFGDVDVLVPREAMPMAEAALMKHGWSIGSIDPYDQRYYRRWMHELPPMTHLHRGTVVDLHHNILPLSARHVPDAGELLRNCEPIPGTGLCTLAPADMVIHSALHLFHEGELKNGLRDLLDLHELTGQFAATDPQFWTQLPRRAQTLGLVWPLHLALRYAALLLATPVPSHAVDELARLAGLSPLRQRWLDFLYVRGLRPEHSLAGDAAVPLVRLVLYVRGHALRMPLPRLAVHLGRKLALRTVMHSSRRAR